MKEMLSSSTRLILITLIVSLVAMMFYSLHGGNIDLFKVEFAVFSNIISAVLGHFIGKSTTDSINNTPAPTPTPPTTDTQAG